MPTPDIELITNAEERISAAEIKAEASNNFLNDNLVDTIDQTLQERVNQIDSTLQALSNYSTLPDRLNDIEESVNNINTYFEEAAVFQNAEDQLDIIIGSLNDIEGELGSLELEIINLSSAVRNVENMGSTLVSLGNSLTTLEGQISLTNSNLATTNSNVSGLNSRLELAESAARSLALVDEDLYRKIGALEVVDQTLASDIASQIVAIEESKTLASNSATIALSLSDQFSGYYTEINTRLDTLAADLQTKFNTVDLISTTLEGYGDFISGTNASITAFNGQLQVISLSVLENSISISELQQALQNYVLTDTFTQTLEDYVTEADLTTTLTGYVTNPNLASTLTDYATKTDLNQFSKSLDFKESVKTISTENVTLSGEQTVNGVALVAGDRVLVNAQTDPIENGIYVVSADAWARAEDANETGKITPGALMFIEQGDVDPRTQWVLSGSNTPVIGTDPVEFVKYYDGTMAPEFTAGDGLKLVGTAFTADTDEFTITTDLLTKKLTFVGSTDNVTEGVTNLYFTEDRVSSSIANAASVESVANKLVLRDSNEAVFLKKVNINSSGLNLADASGLGTTEHSLLSNGALVLQNTGDDAITILNRNTVQRSRIKFDLENQLAYNVGTVDLYAYKLGTDRGFYFNVAGSSALNYSQNSKNLEVWGYIKDMYSRFNTVRTIFYTGDAARLTPFYSLIGDQTLVIDLITPQAGTYYLPGQTASYNYNASDARQGKGLTLTYKDGKGDAATNNITIRAGDNKLINGQSTYVINTNHGAATFTFNGTGWDAYAHIAGAVVGTKTSAATPSTIVERDSSGSFSVNTVTAESIELRGAKILNTRVATSNPISIRTESSESDLADHCVLVNLSSPNLCTVNLPATAPTGMELIIKDARGDAATNNIRVYPPSGTIDGQSYAAITSNFGVLKLLYTGSAWTLV